MNELLKYGKDSVKVGFADSGTNFYDASYPPKDMQINYVNTLANNCRSMYKPIFANESQYLPVSDTNVTSAMDLTQPPQESQNNDLMNALLFGGVAIVLYKLFS
jgi:hypothetical protein